MSRRERTSARGGGRACDHASSTETTGARDDDERGWGRGRARRCARGEGERGGRRASRGEGEGEGEGEGGDDDDARTTNEENGSLLGQS